MGADRQTGAAREEHSSEVIAWAADHDKGPNPPDRDLHGARHTASRIGVLHREGEERAGRPAPGRDLSLAQGDVVRLRVAAVSQHGRGRGQHAYSDGE